MIRIMFTLRYRRKCVSLALKTLKWDLILELNRAESSFRKAKISFQIYSYSRIIIGIITIIFTFAVDALTPELSYHFCNCSIVILSKLSLTMWLSFPLTMICDKNRNKRCYVYLHYANYSFNPRRIDHLQQFNLEM